MERIDNILKRISFLIFVFLYTNVASQDLYKDIEYIKTFAPIAVEEMDLYKIPASIKLAQGLLETAFGQSELAQNANNHFGIKCKKEWTGETYRHSDDAYKECFRKYNNPKESYRDHSLFLAERPYYKDLFSLDIKDYKAWAHGLKKAGYATNPKYAELLISRIEKYRLDRFDYIKPHETEQSLMDWFPSIQSIDEIEEVEVYSETTATEYSESIDQTSELNNHPEDNSLVKKKLDT